MQLRNCILSVMMQGTGETPATTPPGPMQALYIDDSVTTCDCCGRTNLQATVAMQLDCGGILHYGRTCAARNSGKSQKQIRQEIHMEEAAKRSRADWEYVTSEECRSLRTFLSVAAGEPKGWMTDHEERLRDAARAAKKRIAAKHGVMYGSF